MTKKKMAVHTPYSDDELATIALRGPLNTEADWRWLTTVANLKMQIAALEEALARTKKGGRPASDNPARSTIWRRKKKSENS